MRTTLDIKEAVLEDVVKLTGQKNKSKAVEQALEEYVRHMLREELISLLGTMQLEPDWRKLRSGEMGEGR